MERVLKVFTERGLLISLNAVIRDKASEQLGGMKGYVFASVSRVSSRGPVFNKDKTCCHCI